MEFCCFASAADLEGGCRNSVKIFHFSNSNEIGVNEHTGIFFFSYFLTCLVASFGDSTKKQHDFETYFIFVLL